MGQSTIVITGATDGLGRYLARELTASGEIVIAHGRNSERLAALREELGVETVQADLADLRQVTAMAAELSDRLDRLDVLVNNAGVGFGPAGAGRELSVDGYELRFAVNYLAGYHLTKLLLPLVVRSAPARIVNVSSIGQEPLDFDDPMLERSYDGMLAYRRSKLAQIMFTHDLADVLAGTGVTVNALHPATLMNTTMVAEFGGTPRSSLEEGGRAAMRLVRDPELTHVSGRYFDGVDEASPHPQAADPAVRQALRELSDRLVAAAVGVNGNHLPSTG